MPSDIDTTLKQSFRRLDVVYRHRSVFVNFYQRSILIRLAIRRPHDEMACPYELGAALFDLTKRASVSLCGRLAATCRLARGLHTSSELPLSGCRIVWIFAEVRPKNGERKTISKTE